MVGMVWRWNHNINQMALSALYHINYMFTNNWNCVDHNINQQYDSYLQNEHVDIENPITAIGLQPLTINYQQ